MAWSWVLAVGVAQGVFLGVALPLLGSRNRIASGILAGLVWLLTWGLAEELVDEAGLYERFPHTICAAVWTELAIAPLLFLLAKALAGQPISLRRGWVHFLPLLVGWVAWLPFYARSGEAKIAFLDEPISAWMVFFVAFKAICLFAYLGASWWVLRRASTGGGGARARSPWVRFAYLGFGLACVWLYFGFFTLAAGWEWGPDPDSLSGLVAAVGLYGIAAVALLRPRSWSLTVSRGVLSHGRRRSIAARVREVLDEQSLFLDPELSLSALSQAVGVTPHHLSEVLRQELKRGFYEYLTEWRLNHVAAALRDPELGETNVLDLAMAAGFNSKATFYRAFREKFQQTPSQYRRSPLPDA